MSGQQLIINTVLPYPNLTVLASPFHHAFSIHQMLFRLLNLQDKVEFLSFIPKLLFKLQFAMDLSSSPQAGQPIGICILDEYQGWRRLFLKKSVISKSVKSVNVF